MKKLLLIMVMVSFGLKLWSQCGTDNCSIANDVPVFSYPTYNCCTTTTAGMTFGSPGFADFACVNMGTGIPDVYMSITPQVSGYLSINFTPTTIGGTVQYILFDNFSGSDNCPSLAAGGFAYAYDCFTAGTPGVTDTINSAYVYAGERYWVLVSSPPGSTPGSFNMCFTILTPTGGMDCPDAISLCTKAPISLAAVGNGPGSIFGSGSVEDVSTGPGSANTQLTGSCFGNGPYGGGEVNSQWYKFTCGQSGTLQMAINPLNTTVTCGTMCLTSDDYDFMLLDISKTAAPYYTCNLQQGSNDSAVVSSCNWAGGTGCAARTVLGVTGFGIAPSYTSVFGYTSMQVGGCAVTDDFYNVGAPGAWSTSNGNIVCGNTYALLISNYTGASTLGFDLSWGGTGLFGVQPASFSNPIQSTCNVTSTITSPLCAGGLIWSYKYTIDWGDGTTTIASSPAIAHSYTTLGTYTITMLVVDPVGCQEGYSNSVVIDCALPVQLNTFSGIHSVKDKLNRVDWVTNSEINNAEFIVESSPDAIIWTQVGKIPGAGNSNTIKYYHLNDYNYYDITYYRLKQIDYDGASVNYGPILVKVKGGIPTINGSVLNASIYPNPTDNMVTVNLPNDLPSYIMLYDLNGRQIFNQTLQGSLAYQLSFGAIEKGIYIVSISSSEGSYFSKIVIE